VAYNSDEVYDAVKTYLTGQSINTQPEVQNFRVPGERRDNSASPTAGQLFDCLAAVSASLSNRHLSRRRVRRDALRLFKEGQL